MGGLGDLERRLLVHARIEEISKGEEGKGFDLKIALDGGLESGGLGEGRWRHK